MNAPHGTALALSLAALLGACRSDRERSPDGDGETRDNSTAVGNPGDMTVGLGPAPVALRSAGLPLEAVRFQGCEDEAVELVPETRAIDLVAVPAVTLELPRLEGGICGIELVPSGPLALEGELEDGRPFGALVELGALAVAVDTVDEAPLLDVVLGAQGWLDLAWLPTTEEVWLGPASPVHDAIVDQLAGGLAVLDRTTGEILGQTREQPPTSQPDAIVAVGLFGQLQVSFDGGVSWPVELGPPDGTAAENLEAVVAVPDHPLGPRAVAVGGQLDFHALRITVGPEVSEAPAVDLDGLRALAWTGVQFLAVGEQGTVTRSTDGTTWDDDPRLGDCELLAVEADGQAVLAAGWLGCSYVSDDGGMSWAPGADLPGTALQVLRFDGRWVARLDDGTLVVAEAAASSWTPFPLDGDIAHDLLVDDDTLRILGSAAVYATTDLVELSSSPDTGLRRWVGGGEELLAMTEDGSIFAAPAPEGTGPLYWSYRGPAPEASDGSLPLDFAVWER